jgi:excisionase family DNA binding protein
LPHWITTQEAAELSGFHPEYVRWLARQGKIGAEKKGRDWWIGRAASQAYLQTIEALGSQEFDPRGLVMPGEMSMAEVRLPGSPPSFAFRPHLR